MKKENQTEEQMELDFEPPKYLGNPDKPFDFQDMGKGLRQQQKDFEDGVEGAVNVKSKIAGLRKIIRK